MIASDGLLAEFLLVLRAADWVALDTEADSLHAYPEKLCLLQITTTAGDKLIDPLTSIDLNPLWPELKRHRLILHGADYDLRLLRKNHSFVPDRIFDTMLASRLLGEREFGLGNLLKRHLGVSLEKGSQKADWSRRPLTARMEAYARNDTHYLKALADILTEQLRQKGRLAWQEQSCDRLIAECAIPTKPEPDLVWRVRGSNRLASQTLAVLREIWHWREQEAVAANRPPFFVLSHDTIINLAVASTSHSQIETLLPRHFSARRKDGLQEAIQRGLQLEAPRHPQPLRSHSRRQSEVERRRFLELESRRNQRAAELGLDPTLIASRATLLALASDWDRHQNELMAWQRELLQAPAK
ncbi:MAG TPA: HRDC domain-containing protein [Candidatus Cybelea sp.]|nr:HRDC domain-containing protein [Candidatus Cybelea sp.]